MEKLLSITTTPKKFHSKSSIDIAYSLYYNAPPTMVV